MMLYKNKLQANCLTFTIYYILVVHKLDFLLLREEADTVIRNRDVAALCSLILRMQSQIDIIKVHILNILNVTNDSYRIS